MEIEKLRSLLEQVRGGEVAVDDALQSLRTLPFEDLGFSKIDHHRQLRTGFPEVIFCQGKTVEHVQQISERILAAGHPLLATRATPEMYEAVKAVQSAARYNALGRTISVAQSEGDGIPGILVVSAGTSDLPVAEEAVETVLMMGNLPERLYDVGVAGLHRLMSNHEKLLSARVIIVVAGTPECCRWVGRLSSDRRPDEYRLRCKFRWTCCTVRYAQQLCFWCHRREY